MITCVTGDLDPADNRGLPAPHYVVDDDASASAGKYYIAYDEHASRTFQGDALARASIVVDDDDQAVNATTRGAWRTVKSGTLSATTLVADSGAGYKVADGCASLACEPAWLSFAPSNLTLAGVYELAVHVPAFDAEAEVRVT